jgi:acyl dehydratase
VVSATPLPKKLHQFVVGWSEQFGPLHLSVADIKSYAAIVDPQPLHLDEAYAQTTRFGGIIASGMQPYTSYHKQFWIPLVIDSFICGVSIEGVTFSGPVYPEQPFWGALSITEVQPKPEKGTVVVGWLWLFTDAKGAELQRVGFHSYHKQLV